MKTYILLAIAAFNILLPQSSFAGLFSTTGSTFNGAYSLVKIETDDFNKAYCRNLLAINVKSDKLIYSFLNDRYYDSSAETYTREIGDSVLDNVTPVRTSTSGKEMTIQYLDSQDHVTVSSETKFLFVKKDSFGTTIRLMTKRHGLQSSCLYFRNDDNPWMDTKK